MAERYDVKYPVDFRSGGDSVKDAIGKHIEEFNTVYGVLNELAENDLTEEQKQKVLYGNIDGSRVIGNVEGYIHGSHITGTIDGGKITGTIPNATIPASQIDGLKDAISGEIDTKDIGSGIIVSSMEENGCIKFGNGIMFQWGVVEIKTGSEHFVEFPTGFTRICCNVTLSLIHNLKHCDLTVAISPNGIRKSGFSYHWDLDPALVPADEVVSNAKISYFAVGV